MLYECSMALMLLVSATLSSIALIGMTTTLQLLDVSAIMSHED